ncbi:hypothetical protein [Oceanobacter kriegii]|uniref:hypothetical protein n=1 Tax=Oceanobacter kriegii TaxID=64972 RepID=UPI00040736B3|nr:hypothetical protein [Oceanobacter kriegii]
MNWFQSKQPHTQKQAPDSHKASAVLALFRQHLVQLLALLTLALLYQPQAQAVTKSQADTEDTLVIIEPRLQALDTLSNLLMYYNPKFENHDPAIQQKYRASLASLQQWSITSGNAVLAERVKSLAEQIAAIEAQPIEHDYLLPTWINRAIQTHALLDKQLAEPTENLTLEQTIAVHMAMQNLAYQTSTFSSINLLILDGRPDIMAHLDEQVQRDLQQLQARGDRIDVFRKLDTRYQVIRARLIGEQQEWVPNLVSFYYNSMVDLLGQMQDVRVADD